MSTDITDAELIERLRKIAHDRHAATVREWGRDFMTGLTHEKVVEWMAADRLAALIAERDRLKEAVDLYDKDMACIGGCGDGNCLVTGRAKGQHTNGGCRCWTHPEKYTVQRFMSAARRLRNAALSPTQEKGQ